MLDRLTIDRHIESASSGEVDAYLSRCQVDTPVPLVRAVWSLVNAIRATAGNVVDFGCGDARFASAGEFDSYTGYEIDPGRAPSTALSRADVRLECAFGAEGTRGKYSTCIGNPPYVRHHDLGAAWLMRAETRLSQIDGYSADGRSNAYIYFMWLALDCVDDEGLVAMVIPYEWVSRPASAKLREYIRSMGWRVDIYYLPNAGFERVLTTACITLIDKSVADGGWHLHEISAEGFRSSPRAKLTGTKHERLDYERPSSSAYAMRGLSPGDQEYFVLTEELRIKYRLMVGRDLIPAVTSFKHVTTSQSALTDGLFRRDFVNNGKRCWLIRPKGRPTVALETYLATIPDSVRGNYTCANRKVWWQYTVPKSADILYASGFKGDVPKMLRNEVGAVHVGAIHGIYCKSKAQASRLLVQLREFNFGDKVVPLSNGFLKVEVNQMNAVLNQLLS